MKKRDALKALLMHRNDNILVQLFRYFWVGGVAAAIDVGSFIVFAYYFSIDYRVAVFFSFTLGTLTNFALCNAFVFDRKDLPTYIVCFRHYLSSLGGLATNELVMMLLVEILHFNHLFIAKVIATASAFLINFLLIKFYAFECRIKILGKDDKK